MDVKLVVELVQSLGLPIVLVIGCLWFMYKKDQQQREDTNKREEIIRIDNGRREDKIMGQMDKFSTSLDNFNTTLIKLDTRMESLEKQINK